MIDKVELDYLKDMLSDEFTQACLRQKPTMDTLIQKEIDALCDDLYCNPRERDVVQKTIEGIVAAVKIQVYGAAQIAAIGDGCPDYKRTFRLDPDGSASWSEKLCSHSHPRDCANAKAAAILKAIKP